MKKILVSLMLGFISFSVLAEQVVVNTPTPEWRKRQNRFLKAVYDENNLPPGKSDPEGFKIIDDTFAKSLGGFNLTPMENMTALVY